MKEAKYVCTKSCIRGETVYWCPDCQAALCGDSLFKIFNTKKDCQKCILNQSYTGCNRRNVRDFGRVFLRSNYIDVTQNTYIQS